jgi:hypothetical protein
MHLASAFLDSWSSILDPHRSAEYPRASKQLDKMWVLAHGQRPPPSPDYESEVKVAEASFVTGVGLHRFSILKHGPRQVFPRAKLD